MKYRGLNPVKYSIVISLLFCTGCFYFRNPSLPESGEGAWQRTFDPLSIGKATLLSVEMVNQYYRDHHYRLQWTDSLGLRSPSDSLVHFIQSAEEFGLISSDYHLQAIQDLLTSKPADDDAVLLDLYLTDAFFGIHHHLKNGRVNKNDTLRADLSKVIDPEPAAALDRSLRSNTVIQELRSREPAFAEYHSLKEALRLMLKNRSDDTVYIKKVRQLAVNMERWRWQTPLPDRYIRVNSPAFLMEIVEADSVILESKVIVGKLETPTPEMESVIRSFIIYPYWHVPRSIVKEILPHIQNDSLYLRKHNYDVIDGTEVIVDPSTIDWQAYTEENFPYVLRQREGSENTMGVIKFVFRNNYGVYLHDTNARRLFAREKRALSHGCIRVHKAVELAQYLAKDDDTYVSPEDLAQYLLLRHRMEVKVVKPAPLYLQYYTCVEKEGRIVFYDDIYGKDEKLIKVLYPARERSFYF